MISQKNGISKTNESFYILFISTVVEILFDTRTDVFTDMDKRPNACRFKNWHQIKLNNETVSQVWLKPEPHFSQSFHAKKNRRIIGSAKEPVLSHF